MDEKERDQYLLEILDRLARLETKFDEQASHKQTARDALDRSIKNELEIVELRRRLDENDRHRQTDRNEKWGLWLVVVAGFFTVAATLIN